MPPASAVPNARQRGCAAIVCVCVCVFNPCRAAPRRCVPQHGLQNDEAAEKLNRELPKDPNSFAFSFRGDFCPR